MHAVPTSGEAHAAPHDAPPRPCRRTPTPASRRPRLHRRPAPQRPAPARIDQVRAELDELSDYLRKHDGTGTAGERGGGTRHRRPLRTVHAHRPGRHGPGVDGVRPAARPARRGEAAAPRQGRRARRPTSCAAASCASAGSPPRSTTPGLVTVHDAGSEGEELFLVMQYVDGADLSDHLAEHDPYPWQWAVAVAAQLCAVLSAVHAVPIVHRDLKPRNVMVKQDGTVTVLDLGVASVMDTDTTRLTHTGSPIGSPAYMAPEQAMGGAVGPYTDLYALGVLLHELLSGDVPFAGSTALGVLHRHLYEPPLPVRRLRPEVPEAAGSARPAAARQGPAAPARLRAGGVRAPGAAAARARDAHRRARSTPRAPSCARTPPGRTARRTPAPQPPPPRPPRRPRDPTSRGAVDEVKRLLGEGRITQAVDILGAILPAAAEQHGEHSPVVRTLRKQYAATLMDDGQYRRALPELRRLADERAAEAGQADPQSLRFRYEAAQCLEQLGEPAAALAEYRALLPYYENQYVAGDPELSLDVRRRIGHLLLALGDRAAAHDTLAACSTTWTACAARAIRWRRRSGGRCSGWGRCAADAVCGSRLATWRILSCSGAEVSRTRDGAAVAVLRPAFKRERNGATYVTHTASSARRCANHGVGTWHVQPPAVQEAQIHHLGRRRCRRRRRGRDRRADLDGRHHLARAEDLHRPRLRHLRRALRSPR